MQYVLKTEGKYIGTMTFKQPTKDGIKLILLCFSQWGKSLMQHKQ